MQLTFAQWRFVVERIPNYRLAVAKSASAKLERVGRQVRVLRHLEQQRRTVEQNMMMLGLRGQL